MQRALASEAIGTFFLLACVVGSGIMAERLAGGNMAVALLGNTIATGAMLYVLITILGPVSGAHFNPAVSVALALAKKLDDTGGWKQARECRKNAGRISIKSIISLKQVHSAACPNPPILGSKGGR